MIYRISTSLFIVLLQIFFSEHAACRTGRLTDNSLDPFHLNENIFVHTTASINRVTDFPDIAGWLDGPELSYRSGSSEISVESAIIEKPVFSHTHGFHESPFLLQISSREPGAQIFYTTDGTEPVPAKARTYTGPVLISGTTILRAVAAKGSLVSATATSTFLFPGDIVRQPAVIQGYPKQWGPYTAIPGVSPADYEMDPVLTSSRSDSIKVTEALKHLPVVSLATYKGYLFSSNTDPDTGGIYIYTGPPLTNTTNGTGFGWERPVSFEYFSFSGEESFQSDCALRLHGGHSRRPEKSPKHSFRLIFKNEYGPPKAEYPFFGHGSASEFNSLVLRAGFNNTWVHHAADERARAQYIHDPWAKDTYREMGHLSPDETFINLFINGLYWGIYCLSERVDESFAETYFGGNKDEYDVIKDYAEVANGWGDSWNLLMLMANSGLTNNSTYKYIQGFNNEGKRDGNIMALIDVVSLADFMILNFFAGNNDWDHHNWVAIRNRVNPGSGFRFYCWDEEKILESLNTNILNENNDNRPSRIFVQLMKNNEFKRLFADRVQKFCFGAGALTPERNILRWLKRSDEIEAAVPAEAARWGDYRRDVHQYQTAGPFDLYTYDGYWLKAKESILGNYFPQRTSVFIQQLRNAGMFPKVNAPEIRLNNKIPDGRFFNSGDSINMSVSEGIIYYTTDGSDPVTWGSVPKPSAAAKQYSKTLWPTESLHIKSRNYAGGEWSAISEVYLMLKAGYADIKLTEIHYHPENESTGDDKEFEFIEFKNTGSSTLNLGGMTIRSGLEYRFYQDFRLGPGEFLVLASNERMFYSRYGFMPDGQFSGHLNNTGEMVLLIAPGQDTLISVNYSAEAGWPPEADGEGFSLVPKEINPVGSQDNPLLWRRSYHTGGSPGKDDLFRFFEVNPETSEDPFVLYQNFPNPAKSRTTFPYVLKENSHVQLEVFDMQGRKITTVESSYKMAGNYLTEWSLEGVNGNFLPGGLYFYRLSVKTLTKSRQVTKYFIIHK